MVALRMMLLVGMRVEMVEVPLVLLRETKQRQGRRVMLERVLSSSFVASAAGG